MRTTIDIDETLIKEAGKLTGIKKKTHLLEEALRVIIQAKKREKIIEKFGKLKFDSKVLNLRRER